MKPLMHLLLPIIGLLFMFSCSKDDDSAPAQNQEPDSFTVAVTQVTGSTAQLEWAPVTDPDGDEVTYTVFLDEEEILTDLSDTVALLQDLNPQSDYTRKVVASDDKGGTSESTFATEEIAIEWKRFLGGSGDDRHNPSDRPQMGDIL